MCYYNELRLLVGLKKKKEKIEKKINWYVILSRSILIILSQAIYLHLHLEFSPFKVNYLESP